MLVPYYQTDTPLSDRAIAAVSPHIIRSCIEQFHVKTIT